MKTQKGFTLIEAIVATSVFVFVVSSVVAVFISSLQLDRKTRSERTIIQNTRYITDFLAKEIRNGAIDYAKYDDGVADQIDPEEFDRLHIINQAGESETFQLVGSNLRLTKGSDSTELNSTGVLVTKLNFMVTPEVDPFTSALNANTQPIVTLVLELMTASGNVSDRAKTNIQSSFVLRQYPSRE